MLKIFKKRKRGMMGLRSITDQSKQIVKLKTLTPNQKLQLILQNYSMYLQDRVYSDIAIETYENHYEQFMRDGVKNEYIYQKIFYNEEMNTFYYIATQLVSEIYSLKGLSTQQITKKQKKIIEALSLFKDNYLKKDFNFESFYSDDDAREKISKTINNLVGLLKEYCETDKKPLETDMYLER